MMPSVHEPKGSTLRQLRLELGREATVRGSRLTTVARLEARIGELLGERGALLLAGWDRSASVLQTLLDTRRWTWLAALAPQGRTLAEGLSRSLVSQVIEAQEAIHLKSSELGQLWEGPAADGEAVETSARASKGATTDSVLLAPVGPEAVLLMEGSDLGPEDIASAEDLGQFLLVLQQSLLRQERMGHDLDQFVESGREPLDSLDQEQALQRLAEQIRRHLRFDVVAISVVEGKLVHNKVLLGVDEAARARYAGLTSSLEDLEPFLDLRFQVAGSYFIPRDADVYTEANSYCLYCPELEEQPAGMWQPGDNFLTPLRGTDGRVRGTISIDAPKDGQIPTAETARLLELYASRATVVVEAADQIRELSRVNQELRDLDRMRSEFVANISHELHTPVASILGFAHLLLDHGAENLSDRQRHFLTVLAKSTERLSGLVDNLVDISALNVEDPTLKCEQLDLREVYREVLVRLEAQIRVHHLELKEDLGQEPLLVLGDRHRLRQVFFGILSNAVLFNREEGHIQVEMERSSPGMISVRISDSGPGLSKDKLHEILDRFYQVDNAARRLEVDSRMGLSIAYKHVRAHRGNLVLQSEEGAGTRVTVTFPAAAGSH